MSRQLIVQFPFGYLGTFDDNEVEHVSFIGDPGKYRFAVDADKVESNLGMLSFNTRRPDGEHDEWATVGARLVRDPQGRLCGAIALAVRNEETHDVREAVLITPFGIWFNVPVHGLDIRVTQMVAPGGETAFHCQGDGNAVMYDVRPGITLNGVPQERVALSTQKDGNIRDFRPDGQYT